MTRKRKPIQGVICKPPGSVLNPDSDASIPWLTTGHHWLRKRFSRKPFNDGGDWSGCQIVKWVPQGEAPDDVPLWRVQHEDGDTEDMEEHEVVALLRPVHSPTASARNSPAMIPNADKRPKLEDGAKGAIIDPVKRDAYCICKQSLPDRRDGNGMIQCVKCRNWFHLACVGFLTSRRGSGCGYTCAHCKGGQPPEQSPVAPSVSVVIQTRQAQDDDACRDDDACLGAKGEIQEPKETSTTSMVR